MKVLDLFSGIGGFSLGLERAGMETVAFCEYDKKAQLVLKKHWPDVPIFDDVRELTYDKLKEYGILADPDREPSKIRGHDKANAEKGGSEGNHQGRSGTNDNGELGAQANGTDEKFKQGEKGEPTANKFNCSLGGFP
jgi:hypothetical protein